MLSANSLNATVFFLLITPTIGESNFVLSRSSSTPEKEGVIVEKSELKEQRDQNECKVDYNQTYKIIKGTR